MSDQQTPTTEPEKDLLGANGNAAEEARGLSLLRAAQKHRQEREKNLFLAIPSWEGTMIGEYRLLTKRELERLAKSAEKRIREKGDTTQNDLDLIVKANVGLHMLDPESGDRIPIDDEFGLVGYDRIIHVLGKEDDPNINGANDAVRYMMAERDPDDDEKWVENTVAQGIHSNTISRWMRDPSKRSIDLEELLGEL